MGTCNMSSDALFTVVSPTWLSQFLCPFWDLWRCSFWWCLTRLIRRLTGVLPKVEYGLGSQENRSSRNTHPPTRSSGATAQP